MAQHQGVKTGLSRRWGAGVGGAVVLDGAPELGAIRTTSR